MTVTETMIAQVSPFTVGPTGDFTSDDFAQYLAWCGLELDQIDPGLDTETYDYCHALLICHMFVSSNGADTTFKSENIGGYSYTRSDAQIGSTPYYTRFLQVLSQFNTEQATTYVTRDDADETFPKTKFKLDQSPKILFE